MNGKTLKVCPNCGKVLNAHDFLSDYLYMGALESVLDRFRCGNCNYRGLAIEVEAGDYPKIKFPNKRL